MRQLEAPIQNSSIPGQALLLALNAAAATLQRSIQSEGQVYNAFREQTVALGLRGGISLLDESGENLVFKVVAQKSPILKTIAQIEKRVGLRAEGFSVPVSRVDCYYQVINTGRAIFLPDTVQVTLQVMPEQARLFLKSLLTQIGNEPGIFTPLILHGQVNGILNMVGPGLTEEDIPAMQALANHISVALENARLFENLQAAKKNLEEAYQATLEGWVQALDLRDNNTEGHTLRVTEVTLKLAREMGIPEEQLTHIRRGALLHDIGKIAIPDHILHKTGPLSDEERAIMKLHPELALQWLSSIVYLAPALAIPYCHHEHWNGNGYPRGLKGEEIPYEARLFAVVDVWDAMNSRRPYSPGLKRQEIEKFIQDQAGKQFDPNICTAFLSLLQRDEGIWEL